MTLGRPSTTAVHMSRRELALDRRVWKATGGMTLFMAFAIGLISFFEETGLQLRVGLFALVFGSLSIALLLREPPPIGSRLNHAVVALPWVGASAVLALSNIGAGVAVGAAMFIGPLASVRLQDQRQFIAHLAGASVAFFVVAALKEFEINTTLCLLITTMALWVLGSSCWVVLGMAELQGDELDRLVRRDPLTGIGNLRLLEERLDAAVERHHRIKQPFSVILLDLNGFKAINDDLGHADGDALLRGVATALERAVEPGQTVVRQGGDEFCVLLPQSSEAIARRTTNAMRAALAGVGDGVTAGFGIATFPDDAINSDVLLHVADARLREDKSGGPPRGDGGKRRRAGESAPTDERIERTA